LLCGCLAIVQAFEGNLVWAAYFVGIAALLDFLDGFAARQLNVISPIGKDLDSLADMVTFGLVPGVVMYKLIGFSFSKHIFGIFLNVFLNEKELGMEQYLVYSAFLGFSITVFSAIRLAKFNNDQRQVDSFIGLPTPANAILICSLPLIADLNNVRDITTFPLFGLDSLLINPYFLLSLTAVLSFLLVAPIPLFALKFKTFSWNGNQIRYVFLGISFILLITLQFIGIPLVIILYLLISIINNLLNRKKALS
jgi:CDP-diacylglycerol--serine O-phosphatidyltransferase